ncbi:MAG: O-antigen ligase family protein [Alphaproteobacteria bacterium]|nr:O-antigen ligase family protein [Alphaproteobacteria bacterium]
MSEPRPHTSFALRLAFGGLLTVLVLAPLPLGSNRQWAWSLLAIAVAVTLLVWAVGVARTPGAIRIPWSRHLPATVAFLLAIAWFCLQASGITPAAWDHPLWAQAAAALDKPDLGGAISLNPNASFDGAMRLLAYGAVFWLAMHFCRSRRRTKQLLWAIVISGSVYAVYGLAVQFSGTNTILWFDKWAYENVVTSTFVNRNNFATYAGLVIVAAFGLLTRKADEAAELGIANRAGIAHILDSLGPQVFGLFLALFVTGTALLLTASRGGILSTGFGILVFLAGLALYKRRRLRHTIVFAGIVILGGILLISFSGREVILRLNQSNDDLSGRGQVWEMTREAFAERPVLGTGLNTFADVAIRNRSAQMPPQASPFLRAHNGYLEMLLEGGIVGFGLIMFALAWAGGWCIYGIFMRHEDGVFPIVGLSAIAVVGAHAWVDFSLQIPAVAVTFAAIAAAGCAQANRHRRA